MDQHDPPRRFSLWAALLAFTLAGALGAWGADALLTRLPLDAAARSDAWLAVCGLLVAVGAALLWKLLRRLREQDAACRALVRERDLMVRFSPAGIARIALTGRVLWVNERLRQWLALTPHAADALNIRDVVRRSDADAAALQLPRLLSGEIDHYMGEYHCRRASDGQVVPLLGTTTLVPRAGNEPEHLVCVLQDMSEIRDARLALEHSETRLRLALEGSGGGVWDWDLLHRQLTFSAGVQRLLHYAGGDFSHEFRWLQRLHADDRRRVVAAIRYALASGQPFAESGRLRCFDGEFRWFMARGMRHLDDLGRTARFTGILTDQSEERRDEERRRLAATVVDNTVEGVVVTDAHNRILSVNAAFTRLLGYSESELLGKTPRLFKSGRHDRIFYEAMWERLARTGHWQGEIWNRRKNGEIFPEHMSLSSVRDATGKVTHYVCMFTDISEEKARHQRLEFLAHNDPLTGLVNRNWFAQQLEQAMHEARASGEHMAVLLLNLDRFKDVNDSYGHATGDEVLKHIARKVQAAMRPGYLLSRVAGDELGVLARHLRRDEEAADVARDMIAAAADPWRSPEGFEVMAGASVGICLYPEHAATAQTLLQGAHAAVYGAKARGRGAWCFFDEKMTAAARERLALESRLRHALVHGQLRLYYQPQVDIATGRITGAEALVRWIDPLEGAISPARFIPVAESSGVIGPLGEWVMREVCHQGQRWREAGLPALTLALNVSPRQFHLTDLVGCAASALRDTGYPATLLELEITEGALAERPEEARQVLLRLRELGVRMAVDDFGTGYSSLAHLKRFPIDVLKIDRGFIKDIPQNTDDMAICTAIIAMAHSLGLSVLAEGVETQEQLGFLRERGCDSYQGYLCSQPMAAPMFTALLQGQAPA
ncbi:MAG: bifunctional diguanylate cyclase/phosphodiesterase [Comamonadaceae bacterium]|nr:MAG: bifunctional diguanylate cyclase/phosphodiesterase [Comamonadaceae bacterium]